MKRLSAFRQPGGRDGSREQMAAPRTSLSVGDTLSRMEADRRAGDLVVMRRVRDRIDRNFAQPLDVEALARGANMSAGTKHR